MSSSAFTPTTTQVTTEVPVNVPVVGAWQSYNLTIGATITAPTPGTILINEARWRRVGDSMEIYYSLRTSTAGTVGNGVYLFPLPSGYTADSSKMSPAGLGSSGAISIVGPAEVERSSIIYAGAAFLYNSTNIAIQVGATGQAITLIGPLYTLDVPSKYTFRAVVPIAEWAGSGTTTLADRAVEEYLSTSSFSSLTINRGPNGSTLPTTTPSGTFESISFGPNPWNTTWLPTDIVSIEVDPFGSGKWTSISGSIEVVSLTVQEASLTYIGLGFYFDGTNWILLRGKYRNPNSTNGAWSSTSAGLRYRIKKVSSGAQVGYPISTKNIVGATDGVAPVTGMLGEIVSQSRLSASPLSLTSATAANVTATALTIQAGTWDLNGFIGLSGSATSLTLVAASIGTTSATLASPDDSRIQDGSSRNLSSSNYQASLPTIRVSVSSPTTYYLVGYAIFSGGTANVYGKIQATRIA
jgi:hypothetical protein